ncbi:MAG: hypothetical protein K0S32_4515 [Bacteroidetes bacterium]|jgi:hypothetical protein|nr:hypothetical protein [Bacteroidota bacterium]
MTKLSPGFHLCLFVLCLAMFSCSVQKRHYRNGFYVSHSSSPDKDIKTKPKDKVSVFSGNISIETSPVTCEATPIANRQIFPETRRTTPPDSCGDMIYYHNGSETAARIIELTDKNVVYKKCEGVNQTFLARKKDVLMVKYADGSVKAFQNEEPKKKIHESSWEALVCAICAPIFLVLSLFSPYMLIALGSAIFYGIREGIIARREIKAEPEKYRGMILANVSLGVVLLTLAATAALFVALIAVIAGA